MVRSRTLVFDNTLKLNGERVKVEERSRTLVFDNTLKRSEAVMLSLG